MQPWLYLHRAFLGELVHLAQLGPSFLAGIPGSPTPLFRWPTGEGQAIARPGAVGRGPGRGKVMLEIRWTRGKGKPSSGRNIRPKHVRQANVNHRYGNRT